MVFFFVIVAAIVYHVYQAMTIYYVGERVKEGGENKSVLWSFFHRVICSVASLRKKIYENYDSFIGKHAELMG